MNTDTIEELLYVSVLWAVCVVLYYFAGKKLGYATGYEKGIEVGFKQCLSAMSATSDMIQESTHD
jgi:hypothetical protein